MFELRHATSSPGELEGGLPSTEEDARLSRWREHQARSGESTKLRALIEWAHMGVTTMFCASGSIIGPPADME